MAEVFPKGFFCNINLYAYIHGHEQRPSIVGLAMVTMCLSSEQRSLFYLCHLCDKICTEGMIVDHLISPEHYISYFNYTDPDVLSFAWLPSMSMLNGLRLGAFEENKKIGHGVLQVLDLPKDQFNCIRDLCYAKAMSTLEENVNLALKLKDRMPTRMSLQSYIAKPSRKHTLIGLQHLVECVCDGESEKSFHLCTLCQTTLRRNTVINHVISFDHLYCYINSWHPSSLGPKHSYLRYSTNFNSAMCQYAKQVVERGGTETNIKLLQKMPFAWDFNMDVRVLGRLALEEQQANRDYTLKVFDIPSSKFSKFTNNFFGSVEDVIERHELCSVQRNLRDGVPTKTLQKVDGGHSEEKAQVVNKKTTTEGNTNRDSHPAEIINEESKEKKEEDAELSEVAPLQTGKNIKQETPEPVEQELNKPENGGEKAQVAKRTESALMQTCSQKVPEKVPDTVVSRTDRLVAIMYEKRRQSYCMLCSVRLKNKDHMTSKGHRYKYVQLRYPDWTMEGEMEIDEKKMLKMVIHLAEIEKEKGINIKTLEVNCEVYKRLAAVSEEEEHKDELLRDIAWKISEREFYDEMDAQNISREKQLNGLFDLRHTYNQRATFGQGIQGVERKKYEYVVVVYNAPRTLSKVNQRCQWSTPFYLCVACGNILSQGMMLLHVQRPRHLQKYLSVRYPTRFEEVVWTAEVGVLTAELLQRAKELLEQNLDEPGTMQRIPLPLEEFKMIRTMTFDKALSRLHTIYRNQSQSELLTCVTSKPQPAVEHPSEDGSDQLRGVKRRRLASPPPDGVTLLPAERSHTMENEKKEIRGASKLISSQANSFPALVPASFSESSQAAAVSLVSLSHDPDKGAGPGAHIPVKADNGSLVKMAPDKGKYLEAAGSSKDKTKCNSKPGLKKSSTTCSPNHNTESKAFSSYPVQSQVCSSVPSATNCSAGRFAEPVSRVAVIRGASNPHAENTADPCALLPQQDPGFQGYFRLKQTQTGTNPNSSASSTFQLLTEPAPTVSSGPIESIGGLATNLSTTACSSISASTQSNPFTYNITEETPAMAGTQGYSTGQSYYPLSSYHTNALTPSMSVYRAPYNPPFYSANMNHNAMGTPRVGPPNQGFQAPMFGGLVHHGSGQLASQLPRPCMVMASQYLSWQGVTPATEYGEMASAYHGPASYSQGLQRASTNGNNMVISNPSRHHSISNLLEFQGVQATTHYNCTSAAIPRVVTSEGHPQGVATFDFSNDAADGTD
ncbi:hypothetical protein NHX12_023152 [Muraenolepis orangiensis]|uniref:Uncharacterized protein n=1 Tax=Muraenolepis orangiensis TaxID=630683 RepID=A0A9Q0ISH6_9TELE|nr:hypothetical protein NHX12_023152 [Muraenolepis orangiensis]